MQYFDKVVYTFSADNEPTGTIDSGEIVIFRTQDCFSNQMHSESQLVTSCDYSKMNPATGPLFVRDAQPGDVIKVELLEATGTAGGNGKVLNLASNYASLFTYLMNGLVVFHIGIPCAISNILGNLLGSHFALKKGARFIRPMMLVVLVLLLGKLISDAVL